MEIDADNKAKLERYLRNADKFLWGVIPGTKATVLACLQAQLNELGYDIALPQGNSTVQYAFITDQLVAALGIDRLLADLIATNVRRQFSSQPSALDLLRAHWQSGGPPKWQTLLTFLKPKTLDHKRPVNIKSKSDLSSSLEMFDILDAFLQFNIQNRYVHGWKAFAGIWFEEIEPLSSETGSGNHRRITVMASEQGHKLT